MIVEVHRNVKALNPAVVHIHNGRCIVNIDVDREGLSRSRCEIRVHDRVSKCVEGCDAEGGRGWRSSGCRGKSEEYDAGQQNDGKQDNVEGRCSAVFHPVLFCMVHYQRLSDKHSEGLGIPYNSWESV